MEKAFYRLTYFKHNDYSNSCCSFKYTCQRNKNNLNELIKAYLNETLEESKYKYDVYLDEVVHLEGELPVFSTSIPLYIKLQPNVQDNGDIILKQKSIKLGLLRLPNEKILEY